MKMNLHRLFKFILVLVAVVTAGCAAPVVRTPAEDQKISSVAVISLLNEKTTVDRIGLTVFNNKSVLVDQTGKLNLFAIDTIEGALRTARPSWQIKDARGEVPTLAQRMNAAGTSWLSPVSAMEKDLAALAAQLDVDALFVVLDSSMENSRGRGVGAFARTMSLTSVRDVTVHAVNTLVLVDRAGKMITLRGAPPYQVIPAAELGIDYDMAMLSTTAGQDRFRSLMQERLRAALLASAKSMGY
jgi:hypothetical protein